MLRQLVLDGLPVIEFQRVQQRLEEAFIGILRHQNSHSASQLPPPARIRCPNFHPLSGWPATANSILTRTTVIFTTLFHHSSFVI